MVDWEAYGQTGFIYIRDHLPRLAFALLTLVIGWYAISIFVHIVDGRFKTKSVDKSLRPFLKSLMLWSLRIVLLISVGSMLGMHMTSFVALLGAAGLAVGLSLQGSLSNFAGGVLLLLFKPIKVDEYIEARGTGGTVQEITIFYTILHTPDNKYVTIPNGPLANDVITNYSRLPERRHDIVVQVDYADNLDKAMKELLEIMKKDRRIRKKEPAEPVVFVKTLNDSGVDLLMRFWSTREDYWDLEFDLRKAIKQRLDKAGISIPYPQMDVHVRKQ